jgi:hypothetical protein
MRLVGVSNHSPEQLLRWLTSRGQKDKNITVVPEGKKIKSSRSSIYGRLIIFSSFSDFKRNIHLLDHPLFDRKMFFVHGSCAKLYEFSTMFFLDFRPVRSQRNFGFELLTSFRYLSFSRKAKSSMNKDKSRLFMNNITEAVKEGSILNRFMSSIYKIKGSDNQKKIALSLCNWVYSGGSIKILKSLLNKTRSVVGFTQSISQDLESLLTSDLGLTFQEAFQCIRMHKKNNEDIPYQDISKKYGVPPFELKYIMIKLDNALSDKESVYDKPNRKSK